MLCVLLLDDEYDNIIMIVRMAHDYGYVVSMSQLEILDDYYLVLITINCQIKADMDSFSVCDVHRWLNSKRC